MNANKLKGLIAEAGLSQRALAEKIGISAKTFYDKMKAQGGGFKQWEIAIIIDTLKLTPVQMMEAFFPGAIQK